MKIFKSHWFWVAVVAILIAIGSFACDLPVPCETGRVKILTDFAGPYYQEVNGYREGANFYMPECHDYTSGRVLVNVDITNITVGFTPMVVKFPSCD
jgi:hypothetical protein